MIESPNDTVRVELDNHLLTITLNRPDMLNALNREMTKALGVITEAIPQEPTVRVVLLQGAGDHFMAGGDLKEFQVMRENASDSKAFAKQFEEFVPEAQAPIRRLRSLRQPVLASVRGSAAGYGFSLMNACDMVIAADNAVFTIAYARIGISPDGGSSWTLPRIVGYRRAFELMALSDRFDADTALQFGLVNRVVDLSVLSEETASLADRLVAAPAVAIGNTKQLLAQSPGRNLEEQLAAEGDSFVECAAQPDFEEGLNAFLEKRSAKFNH